MDLAAIVAIGCAAVDVGRPHLNVRRQTARAARATRKAIDKPKKEKEEALRCRAHAINHNRTAATRKDEQFAVSGKREQVKGSGAWRKWTAAALLRVTFLQVKEQLKVMSRLLNCGATYCQNARSAICNVWLDSQAQGVFYR